jgi:UDP-N-acetylmuramyl pentapeptide phosphotransferase/UDP-N-acetylglucosamine-1-phosphate transferase
MPTMLVLLAALSVLCLSSWLTKRFCNPASRFYVLDHPNERSLHSLPTPRTGGVAILAAVLGGFVLIALWEEAGKFLPLLGLSAVLMASLSFMDDRRGLPVRVRLLGHLVSAGILVASGLVLNHVSLPGVMWEWPAWMGVIFSFLFLIWMVNLYNFMDGMDGFAGGMAVIGFGTLALLGVLAGNSLFAATGLMIAAATAGFLVFNFPPARIFMGDTGSSVLGLLAGALVLWAARANLFPFWVGLLVFSPFLVDATVTLLRRLLRGERVWQAHKTHYYQRLVQLGWGHRRTVLWEYALMFACCLSALGAQQLDARGQGWILFAWCLVYPALMLGVARLERRLRQA